MKGRKCGRKVTIDKGGSILHRTMQAKENSPFEKVQKFKLLAVGVKRETLMT